MGLPGFVKLETLSDFAWIFCAMFFTIVLFLLLVMRCQNMFTRYYSAKFNDSLFKKQKRTKEL